MNLPDAISESLVQDIFFGLEGTCGLLKAVKTQKLEGVDWATHAGVTVYKVYSDGMALPYSFSVEEILFTTWELKTSANEIHNNSEMHAGIIEVSADYISFFEDIFQKQGHGVIDSIDINNATDTARVFCRSSKFNKVESGEPTPNYRVTYEQDTGALTIELIAV